MGFDSASLVKRDAVGKVVAIAALSHDGMRVVYGSEDSLVRVWDTRTAALAFKPLEGHTNGVASLTWSLDNTLIASGSRDHTIRIWDARTGTLVGGPLRGHTGTVWSVAFSRDGTRLASGSSDTTVRIWDMRIGTSIGKPLRGHTKDVYSVAFSPDDARIVSGSRDRSIRVWNARAGVPVGIPLMIHNDAVSSVVFSPDNTRIASSSWDATICIWDSRTGDIVGGPLEGHTSAILSAAFSHDGTRIVSGSSDLTIRIWDVVTGMPVDEPVRGHMGGVTSVAFSPDSTWIVSGSQDSTICIWEAPQSRPLPNNTCVPSFDTVRSERSIYSFNMVANATLLAPVVICLSLLLLMRYTVGLRANTVLKLHKLPPKDIKLAKTKQSSSWFEVVTSEMSVQEMFECLVEHGCTDLTLSTAGQKTSAVIASGGFGDVRRMAMNDGTVVAIKTLRLHILLGAGDKAIKRAVREVYVWSRLRHVNVQELLGIIVFQGGLGMVSPWMKQGNLQQYIAAHPDVERNPLCVQLASGLSYLHEHDMVHGDIKASNVLVSDNGTLKINDFDHAILAGGTLQFTTTTRLGGGTLRWMAPELYESEEGQKADEPQVTRSKETDIYALGMTMLEIFTGTVPFSEYRTEAGVCSAILKKQIPRRPNQLSGLDEQTRRMWELLVKCWDYDSAARPDASTVLRYMTQDFE